jgi:hypothetical protein
MQTSQFIEELTSGNASVAKDILNDMLSTRAFESLDAKAAVKNVGVVVWGKDFTKEKDGFI